jgi:hypothetical protein
MLQSVGNERGKKEKSNKSGLWNHVSYKGLPYIFVVTVRAVFSDAQNFYFLTIHSNSFEISN